MNLNPPRRVRAILYLVATFGTPLTIYGVAEGVVDKPLAALLGTALGIISGLATANTAKPDQPQA